MLAANVRRDDQTTVRVRLRNRWRFRSDCGKRGKSCSGSFKDGRSRCFVSSAGGGWTNFHGPVIPYGNGPRFEKPRRGGQERQTRREKFSNTRWCWRNRGIPPVSRRKEIALPN